MRARALLLFHKWKTGYLPFLISSKPFAFCWTAEQKCLEFLAIFGYRFADACERRGNNKEKERQIKLAQLSSTYFSSVQPQGDPR